MVSYMSKSLCVIGEALIDFIPDTSNCALKEVPGFKKAAGGAPANVAGTVAKLGGSSTLLTKLGDDAFGHYLLDSMELAGIDTQYVVMDKAYDTSLAFVSLEEDGNRQFKFYRRTAADLNYSKEDIQEKCLENCGIVDFCSVDLVPSKMRQAHEALIEMARKKGILICFDPNLRLSLWEDHQLLKTTVKEFIQYADIVKISDEELEFICDTTDIQEAVASLLNDQVKMVIYTKGKDGTELFTKNQHVCVDSYKVNAIDTTGAGDTFIGAFLYNMLANDYLNIDEISDDQYREMLDLASLYAGYMTTVPGALASLADQKTIESFRETL